MAHRNWDSQCKVYVGGLRDDANRYDLEDAFARYGPVKNVWVARRPPGFAFVEMETSRDAEDAVKGLDGSRVCGSRVKVEISTGGGGRGGRDRSRSRERRRSRSPARRSRRSPSYRSMSRERDDSRDRSSKRDRREKKEVSRSRSRS